MTKHPINTRLLHWLSALLIIGLFFLGLWMRSLDYYSAWYQTAPNIHKQVGLLVFVLMTLRLLWRMKSPSVPALNTHKAWEIKLGHAVHLVLYVAIFVILFSGYFISTADNKGIEILGLFDVPPLITAIDQQEDIAGLIHEYVAYGLMALVGLHIAGALKHHFVDKDTTIKRML